MILIRFSVCEHGELVYLHLAYTSYEKIPFVDYEPLNRVVYSLYRELLSAQLKFLTHITAMDCSVTSSKWFKSVNSNFIVHYFCQCQKTKGRRMSPLRRDKTNGN